MSIETYSQEILAITLINIVLHVHVLACLEFAINTLYLHTPENSDFFLDGHLFFMYHFIFDFSCMLNKLYDLNILNTV